MHYFPRGGLNVPVITVVDDGGDVLADEQRRVIRHAAQRGRGADVVFANGTTGEWNRLSNSQRRRLMEITVEEVRAINGQLASAGSGAPPRESSDDGRHPRAVEAWLGVNGDTRAEVLANLETAIRLGADAAVIAPLAINDLAESEIVPFFRGEINALIEAAPAPLAVFLYDNADINAPRRRAGRAHLRTRVVEELSRLPWVCGLKVSSPRRVFSTYARVASHFKQSGEFGLYVGNANLIFDWFRPRRGPHIPRHLPIGVVSGPANVFPREWQKAWRVCRAGDEGLMREYQHLAAAFERLTAFAHPSPSHQYTGKMIACLKTALEVEGVIASATVARGTPPLSTTERRLFRQGYAELKEMIRRRTDPRWQTFGHPTAPAGVPQTATSPPPVEAE